LSEIQQARYDKLLRRVADLKGPGSKVSEALGDLFPTLDVERVPGELLALSGYALCFGSAAPAPVAAQAPRTMLFNPPGSGKLLTVSSFTVSTINVAIIRYAISITELTSVISTQVFRDPRLGLTARPTGQISQQTSVALTGATGQFQILPQTPFRMADPNGIAVLPPGTGLEVGGATLNSTIHITYFWRERNAEPSELNL